VTTVHIAIGNSDDKLSQHEWSLYVQELRTTLRSFADVVHGVWFSAPDTAYQNCCVAVEVQPDLMDGLRAALLDLRRKYRQKSVAVNMSDTEFV
jgi:hypothetical protein